MKITQYQKKIYKLLGVSKATVTRGIRDSSKIEYVGSSKNGYWKVNEQ